MTTTPRDDSLEDARRYVRRKRIFFTVLGVWIALCVMWFLIDLSDDSSSWWFYWPMLGTGIGVPLQESCSWGSAVSSALTGNAARSRSICAAEATNEL
jgi:hypothetical protein